MQGSSCCKRFIEKFTHTYDINIANQYSSLVQKKAKRKPDRGYVVFFRNNYIPMGVNEIYFTIFIPKEV